MQNPDPSQFLDTTVFALNIQLTLEQCGFEMCVSTYRWIFHLTCAVQSGGIQGSISGLGTCVCGGLNVVICRFLTIWEIGTPNLQVGQGQK